MQRIIVLTFIYFSLAWPIIFGNAIAEAVESKVAILPFDTVDAGKYTSLKDGLRAMISGRLAALENIAVVTPTLEENEQQQIVNAEASNQISQLFKKLDTDYISTGRMVLRGDNLQFQMTFYSEKGEQPISVTAEAEGDSQILPAVEILVLRIEQQVFGLGNDISDKNIVVSPKKGVEGFQTEHPDRKYKEEIISGSSISAEGSGVVIARGDQQRRRSAIDGEIISLAAGDVDNDGIEEIFVATPNDLRVYHYTKGLLEQIDAYDLPASLEVHAVNIADINMDSLSEIYLSAVESNRFSSMVLAWSQQNGFRTVIENVGYGIRPMIIPGEGVVLAGQAKDTMNDSFFKPAIFRLQVNWQNKTITKGSSLTLPKEVNLFDFVVADLESDGLNEIIAINRDMKMVVYGHDNRILWQSERTYGGSLRSLGSRWKEENKQFPTEDFDHDQDSSKQIEYLPIQLRLADCNGDGDLDIISASNELSLDEVLKYFPNLRSFSSGKIVCLTWENGGMKELWQTDTLIGYVNDFDIVIQKENDGVQDQGENVRLMVGYTSGGGLDNLLSFGGEQDALLLYDFKITGQPQD